jgi:TonB family protein
MNRLQKKCLVASTALHGFLLLLFVFGSAFFLAKDKPPPNQRLNVVPTHLIEAALAGGGGNPNLPRTDDRQKGDTLVPQPAAAAPPPQPVQPVRQPPQPPPPQPKPEVKRTESKKPDLPTPPPKSIKPVKPVEVAKPKPTDKPTQDKPRIDLTELVPVARTEKDKRKAQEEAEAREAARQQAAANAAANAAREKLARQIDQATKGLRAGFSGGTKVEVGGPGGEAYAGYSHLVYAAYEDAWESALRFINDLRDDDAAVVVRVTIARDGRVIGARITDRSGRPAVNGAAQRALDAVKKLPPFPDFIKDAERSFTIEFNLKAKRLLG